MTRKNIRSYRNFEIRKLYFILKKHYIQNGYTEKKASETAYASLGYKYCLRNSSLRHARDNAAHSRHTPENEEQFRRMLSQLKELIQIAEKEIEEHF